MKYAIIIPVFNRPEEIKELLQSLSKQTVTNFEVIIVEDGSSDSAEEIVKSFSEHLTIRYFYKENAGQSKARNYGFERAQADYLIVFDSDCIIPPDYLEIIDFHIRRRELDAHGGPDEAHISFTPQQKAINYAMTSIITTAGIRGKMKKLSSYQARSYNMGFKKEVFEKTGGFRDLPVSEDIDLSIRIREAGFKLELIPQALVYHKRRNNFKSFFRQTFNFGKGRMNVTRLHPTSFKLVHVLPSGFVLFGISLLITAWIDIRFFFFQLALIGLYLTLIFSDSLARNKSPRIALLSILGVVTQLSGYGLGYLKEFFLPSLKNKVKTETVLNKE
ncbi:MAG: glycosyltransferase [Bacteroidota bacterium]